MDSLTIVLVLALKVVRVREVVEVFRVEVSTSTVFFTIRKRDVLVRDFLTLPFLLFFYFYFVFFYLPRIICRGYDSDQCPFF